MSIRVEAISVSGAGAAVSGASLAWRRAALWGLVAAKVLASWGVQWDIQWHTIIGRDSFWIAPHLMTYAGVTLTVLLSFGALTRKTMCVGERSETVRSPSRKLDALLELRDCFRIFLKLLVTHAASPIRHWEFGIELKNFLELLKSIVVLPREVGNDPRIGLNDQG